MKATIRDREALTATVEKRYDRAGERARRLARRRRAQRIAMRRSLPVTSLGATA